MLLAVRELALTFVLWSSLVPKVESSPDPSRARKIAGGHTVSIVVGSVFDSVAMAPLAGALVQLAAYPALGMPYSAMSDSAGEYRIHGVTPGLYVATAFHPALDALGIQLPERTVEVAAEGETHLILATPSPLTIRAAHCGTTQHSDSSGVMLGRVRDAESAIPLASGVVAVIWNELVIDGRGIRQERRQRAAKTLPDGFYALCDLPTLGPLIARAEHGSDSSGFVEVQIPPRGILPRDFTIGKANSTVAVSADSAAIVGERKNPIVVLQRGTARLTGTVRTAKGRQLGGSQILVWGTQAEGFTSDDGKFVLEGLPAGTYSLEARHIGYAQKRTTVDLVSNRTSTADIVLEERVAVLDAVRVYGKANARSLSGFVERRLRGIGHYITREDLERQPAVQLTDVLQRVPGVHVTPSGAFNYTISIRGCSPAVFVDGMRVSDGSSDRIVPVDLNTLVRPDDVAGIEVYKGPGGTPAEFSAFGTCGTILIWTGPRGR